ncbi:recombinase family protein [Candidatus Sumerlaeota bacterium]|nr:recombinase family protein [Candidatus Sumerlaeota bacterium]
MKDPSTGRPVENPETAPIVRRLYAQFAKGDSYHGLARQMNAEKISHPGAYQHKANGKPILGSHWTAQAVKLLLTNPVYATGNQQSKRGQIIGAFSPLVDADTARQCASIQESLKHKPNLRSRMNRGVWSNLFSDILKCAACGSPFLIVQAKNLSYRRYGCKSHRDGVCKNGFTLQVKDAERSILNAVAGVIDEGPIADILRQIDHARRSSKDDLDSRKKKLRLAVKECDKALDALTDRFAATDKRALKPIEAKLIQKQEEKDAIESEIRGIEEKLEILESSKKKILMEFVQDVERLRELVRNAERGLTQELEIDVDKVTDEDFEEQVDGVTKEALEKAHEARKRLRLHLKLVLEELIEVVEIDSRGRAKIMFSNKKTQALDLNCGLSGQSS